MSDSESENTPRNTAFFNYNVRWMTHTFNSRTKVESLLGPELASGNITSHDYDAAIRFLPGFHRYYALLLSTAAISAVYVLRKPSWSQVRTLGFTAGGALGSFTLGNALTLKSHFDFVRSLNNPGEFARAIERIQQQSGLPQMPGPIITRKYDLEEGSVPIESTAEHPQQPSQLQLPAQDGRSPNRWDQIRAANAAASTSSSWDALRQKHEKSSVLKSGSTPTNQSSNDPIDDRATEQARFDALLEKERNFGSQSSRG